MGRQLEKGTGEGRQGRAETSSYSRVPFRVPFAKPAFVHDTCVGLRRVGGDLCQISCLLIGLFPPPPLPAPVPVPSPSSLIVT